MRKKLFKILTVSSIGIGCIPFFSGCANSNWIVLANFESYMSTDIIQEYGKEVSFLYFQTNEEVESKYRSYYDIAIPSTYEVITLIKKGWVQRIDWKRFDLRYGDNLLITNGGEALKLFTKNIQDIINVETDSYPEIFPAGENLLDYCIPYFLQKFMFAYKGPEISDFQDANTWEKFTNIIGNKTNPNVNPIFVPTAGNHIGCIDDSRTFYSLCNLIKTQKENPDSPEDWSINPDCQNKSIEEINQDFEFLTNKFSLGHFYFNTDSNEIIQSLSSPNNNQSSFAYNGDILYAAMGADLYDAFNQDNFHIDNLDAAPLALDAVVINSKNANDEGKMEKIYNIVKSIFLDHVDSDEISEMDEEGNFVYNPMINFDFIKYTCPFKTIDDYVLNGSYFADIDPSYTESQIQLYKDIYDIKMNPNIDIGKLVEIPLDNLFKSNMHWSYIYEKEKI